jgi:prevent-host-death family protein
MDEISSTDARKKLDALIDNVNADEDPLVICSQKGNKAVLVSLDDFEWIRQTWAMLHDLVGDEELQHLFTETDSNIEFDEISERLSTDYIQVYQFKVALMGIRPPIWRRIQVPANYTFWDLHVAIQDTMGWFDSHLHEFQVDLPSSGHQERIGIPVEDFEFGEEVIPGWNHYISEYFSVEHAKATYVYDFGDNWEHTVTLEKIVPRKKGRQYPVCLKGKRACPPEDCGGVWGYKDLLEIISDPDHEEYDEMMEWLDEDFDPEALDAALVEFDDPRERWDFAFGEADE